MSDCTLFFFLVQKPPSHCQPKCLPVEVTRTISRKSFLNKFTIIRPPNQWIATRTGRLKVMLLPKGWKLTEVSLLVSITKTRIYSFRNKCVVFARNCKFAKLTKYNMQYLPWNNAFLAHYFWPKKVLFMPKDFQKVRKSGQILILRQNSVC